MSNITDERDEPSFRLLLPGTASSYAAPRPLQHMSFLQQVHAWSEKVRRPFWESGMWCASMACIIFSFSSLQVKLTGGRVPVLQLCLIRSWLSFCTSIAAGTASGIRPLFGHRQNFRFLLMRGVFGTLAIATSYVALLNLPLGDAVTIAQMRPPVTAVMARLLLHEPLGRTGALGSLISVVGVTVVAHPPFLFGGHSDWGQKRLIGSLSGVASTWCGFGTTYAIRRIGQQEPALVVALWFHTTTICMMAVPLLLGVPQHPKLIAPHDCLLLLGIAAASFCAQLLMTRSYQLIAAARAAAVSFTGVIYSHVLGALIFDERVTASTLAGGLLIFAGVIMVTAVRDSSSSSSTGAGGTSGAISDTGSTLNGRCTAGSTDTSKDSITGLEPTAQLSRPAAAAAVQQSGSVSFVLPVLPTGTSVPEVAGQQQQQQQARWPAWLQQLLGWQSRRSSSNSSSQLYQNVSLSDALEFTDTGGTPSAAAAAHVGHPQHQQAAAAVLVDTDDMCSPFGALPARNIATPLHSRSALHGDTQGNIQLQSSNTEGNEFDMRQPLVARQDEPSWSSWASLSSVGSMQEQVSQQQHREQRE